MAQSPPAAPGLFRSALAAPPARMRDVMDALARSSFRYRFEPLARAGVHGGRLPLAGGRPGEGWELIEFSEKGYLVICDCSFTEDRSELVPAEGLTEFHYTVSGPVRVDHSRSESEVEVADLNLVACRAGADATYRVTCLRGRRRSVALFLHDAFLERFLDPARREMRALRREIGSVGASGVYFRTLPINRPLVGLVDQIMRNPYPDQRRLLYAEAKFAELVCATVELWQALGAAPDTLVLKPRDIELLEQARRLILQDLAAAHSIARLARSVGTNTDKLKSGFKFLFGQTIYQFTLKARMDLALHLLASDQAPVGEVAGAVGYSHQSSFTSAFRKYFGYPPTRARNAVSRERSAPGRRAQGPRTLPHKQ